MLLYTKQGPHRNVLLNLLSKNWTALHKTQTWTLIIRHLREDLRLTNRCILPLLKIQCIRHKIMSHTYLKFFIHAIISWWQILKGSQGEINSIVNHWNDGLEEKGVRPDSTSCFNNKESFLPEVAHSLF